MRFLILCLLLVGCSRRSPTPQPGKVINSGDLADNTHACQVFWHPMRTRLPQRGAIAEFADAEIGKARWLRGEWEKRSAHVRWTLLASESGEDRYRFDIAMEQKEGDVEVSQEITMAGEPVVVYEDRYHRVTIAPLKTPPVQHMVFAGNSCLVQQPESLADDAGILV